jgi:CelD/BcsL family acetyltransferase involved in cellulose biosynthesis
VSVVSRTPDLAAFRSDWERLYRSVVCQPSSSYEWVDALTRSHLRPDDGFVLLRIARGSEPLGFVPLVVRRQPILGYHVDVLSPLDENHGTHSDLLATRVDAEVARAFFTALMQLELRWDIFRMSRLLDGHALLQQAEAGLGSLRAAPQIRSGDASYFLALPATYAEYLSQRSQKFRSHLKRTERKIGDLGGVEVVEYAERADVAAAYEQMMRIERSSWKQAHGTAISAVARQEAFYRHLCEGAAATGRLHLQLMTVAGAPAAYNLGFVANGCYFYLKTSYDEAYKPLGVSTYLRARLIGSLISHGIAALDFPAEPYEWERQWTETVRWHKVLTIYRNTAVGRVLSLVDRFRHRTSGHPRVHHVDPRAHRAPAPGR